MTADPLPADWQKPFRVRDALASGITPSRLRGVDLRSDFHGSRRSRGASDDLEARCRSLSVLLDERHAFTGVTAARLWGMPLPRRFDAASDLEVASSDPARAIRRAGVVGSERPSTWEVTTLRGLRVHAAPETWASLGRHLTLHDLVAAAESAVTPTRRRPAITTAGELNRLVRRSRGMTGVGTWRAALARVRVGALSRPETLLRLLLDEAGLPTALINAEYRLRSGRIAIPDLSWPEFLVAVEYDGEYHRESGQFARDLIRTDELVDDGWFVVHVVASQLFARPLDVVARVVQRLSTRGATIATVTKIARFEP